MSEISDMIQRLCPDGVEYRKLGEVVNCLSLSARRRGLATLCVPFPSSSPEGPLQESLSLRGICRTACATSLSARRVGPCILFEAPGLTAFGLFPHKSLQEQAPDGLARKKPSALR